MGHGAQKLFGWFGGYGTEGTGGFFEGSLGMRPGRLMATAAGGNEFVGGLLLALGLAMPLAAVLIASTMIVAIRTAHRGKGLWASDNGAELPLTYGAGGRRPRLQRRRPVVARPRDRLGRRRPRWGLGSVAVALVGAVTVVGAARHSERAHPHGIPTTS